VKRRNVTSSLGESASIVSDARSDTSEDSIALDKIPGGAAFNAS
jgi:hypothetical protein